MGSEQGNNSGNDGASPGRKSLWDKVGLLSNIAMPIMLGVATIVVSVVLTVSSGRSENQRAQATALESYLSEMTGLIADDKFFGIETDLDPSARNAVRARTLGVLSRLNPQQKGFVIQFLYEADLISGDSAIDLGGADLSQANLKNQVLVRVNLSDTNLKEADLSHTVLFEADLSRADLSGANLKVADLEGANLRSAVLNGSDLSGARLVVTNFFGADLRNARLSNASIEGARLEGAIYDESQLSELQLEYLNDRVVGYLIDPTIEFDASIEQDAFLDHLLTAYIHWLDEDHDNAKAQLRDADRISDKKNPFYASWIGNMTALVLATPGKETPADYAGALDALQIVLAAQQDDIDTVEDVMILDTLAFVHLLNGIFGTDGGNQEEQRNDLEWALYYYEKIRNVRPESDLYTDLGHGLAYVEIKEYQHATTLLKAGLNQLLAEEWTQFDADPQLKKLVSIVLERAFEVALESGDNSLIDLVTKAEGSFYDSLDGPPDGDTSDDLRENYSIIDLIHQLDDSITIQEVDLGSVSGDPFEGDLFDQDYGRFLVVSGFNSLAEFLATRDDRVLACALLDFGDAIFFFPKFADAFVGRAITRALLGQNEEARLDIDSAVSLGINRDSLDFIKLFSPGDSSLSAPERNCSISTRQFQIDEALVS